VVDASSQRLHFAISALVIDEASRSDPEASQQRLNALTDIESMMITSEAVT
jgi:hypothetical protein